MRISDWSSDVCSSDLTLAFLRLLLQGDGLQAELVVLHCCGFELQPCAQIADFLGRYCGRQPGSELFEPLRPRCEGSTKVIGQPGRDTAVERIEIEAGARVIGKRSAKFIEQTAKIGRAECRERVCEEDE